MVGTWKNLLWHWKMLADQICVVHHKYQEIKLTGRAETRRMTRGAIPAQRGSWKTLTGAAPISMCAKKSIGKLNNTTPRMQVSTSWSRPKQCWRNADVNKKNTNWWTQRQCVDAKRVSKLRLEEEKNDEAIAKQSVITDLCQTNKSNSNSVLQTSFNGCLQDPLQCWTRPFPDRPFLLGLHLF